MPVPKISRELIRGSVRSLYDMGRQFNFDTYKYLYCNVPSGVAYQDMVASIARPENRFHRTDDYITPCGRAVIVHADVMPIITNEVRKTLVELE